MLGGDKMIVKRIEGMTRNLGAPKDWKDTDPICNSLPIRDLELGGVQFMLSAWEATPYELELLNKGASIHLYVQGVVHPIVSVCIEK